MLHVILVVPLSRESDYHDLLRDELLRAALCTCSTQIANHARLWRPVHRMMMTVSCFLSLGIFPSPRPRKTDMPPYILLQVALTFCCFVVFSPRSFCLRPNITRPYLPGSLSLLSHSLALLILLTHESSARACHTRHCG